MRDPRLLPAAATIVAWLAPSAASGAPDFDGDGISDVGIGAPFENLVTQEGGVANAGSVAWIRGVGGVGLDPDQGSPPSALPRYFDLLDAVGENPEPGDLFGAELAWGDFNCDGFDDLAIGAPFRRVGGIRSGAVFVVYGFFIGLGANPNILPQVIDPITVGQMPSPGQEFGARMTGGRLVVSPGSCDTLVIGSPAEMNDGGAFAGAAYVIPSDSTGLLPELAQRFEPGG